MGAKDNAKIYSLDNDNKISIQTEIIQKNLNTILSSNPEKPSIFHLHLIKDKYFNGYTVGELIVVPEKLES